jgi:protein SCO1/2
LQIAGRQGKIIYMRYLIILLVLLSQIFTFGCRNEERRAASPDAKRYPIKGKVVSVNQSKSKAEVDHEEIPGFMKAMRMSFLIPDRDVINTISPGAEIRAELVVDKDEYWLENVVVNSAPLPGQAVPESKEDFAAEGREVPNFTLTNQNSKKISASDFKGKPWAITFIYSRCPLPEYCIAMSTKFSDLAKKIDQDPELKDKYRLLTISFDPATDTPETLKKYGLGYMGKDVNYDFKTWQLAVGSDKEVRAVADFFGLRYEVDEKDKTQFVHSLRTIAIGPDGKVKKIFTGNEWTIDELLAQMKDAGK